MNTFNKAAVLLVLLSTGWCAGQVTNAVVVPVSSAALETALSEMTRRNTFFISLTIAVGAIVGPLLLSYMNSRNARQIRMEDYARQDLLADRLTAAAKIVSDRADLVAERVAEAAVKSREDSERLTLATKAVSDRAELVAERVAEATIKSREDNLEINGKLEIIHTLTNSAMTSAIQRELDALEAQCALMEELVGLRITMGHAPKKETLQALDTLKAKIKDTKLKLAERSRQAELVELQLKSQKTTADRIKLEHASSPGASSIEKQIQAVPEATATKVVEKLDEQKGKL